MTWTSHITSLHLSCFICKMKAVDQMISKFPSSFITMILQDSQYLPCVQAKVASVMAPIPQRVPKTKSMSLALDLNPSIEDIRILCSTGIEPASRGCCLQRLRTELNHAGWNIHAHGWMWASERGYRLLTGVFATTCWHQILKSPHPGPPSHYNINWFM